MGCGYSSPIDHSVKAAQIDAQGWVYKAGKATVLPDHLGRCNPVNEDFDSAGSKAQDCIGVR